MVGSPRKSNAASKGGRSSPTKAAGGHKKAKVGLKRTHTIAEASREGKAFVRSQNRKVSPDKRRRRVKRPAPVKATPTKVVPVKVESPKAVPAKKAQAKSKVPKKHVKVTPKIGRTKTMQETLAAANAFLGIPNEPEKKAGAEPVKEVKGKAKATAKPKLARKSTIQQTIGAAKGFLKKGRRGKK